MFHHPEAIAEFTSPEMRHEMKYQLDKEIDEYYARFKRYGVPDKNLLIFGKID